MHALCFQCMTCTLQQTHSFKTLLDSLNTDSFSQRGASGIILFVFPLGHLSPLWHVLSAYLLHLLYYIFFYFSGFWNFLSFILVYFLYCGHLFLCFQILPSIIKLASFVFFSCLGSVFPQLSFPNHIISMSFWVAFMFFLCFLTSNSFKTLIAFLLICWLFCEEGEKCYEVRILWACILKNPLLYFVPWLLKV